MGKAIPRSHPQFLLHVEPNCTPGMPGYAVKLIPLGVTALERIENKCHDEASKQGR